MRLFAFSAAAILVAASLAQAGPIPAQIGSKHDSVRLKGATGSDRAQQLLEEAMGRVPRMNVRAIIVQQDFASKVMQQIKVEMSRGGKIHQIVLAPLSFQGIELVDDGVRTLTYTPDDHCVIEQPSARQDADDVPFRMKLVRRNYELKIDRKDRVAGRAALVIKAVPKDDDLPTRCYTVDEKTGFLLRLETCREGADPVMNFEAKVVEFPSDFPENTFRLDASLGTLHRKFEPRCVPPGSGDKLVEDLRFQPVIPNNLPCGFEVQELQASSDSVPALAIRVTDGLAKATVLEWRSRSPHSGAPEGTLVANTGRLTILISGDIPKEVKDRILETFVKASRGERLLDVPTLALSWVQELRCDISLFPLDRDPEETSLYIFAVPRLIQN